MSVGIIYIMNTVVPGLIKIGKTGSKNFENRMYFLEHNGYSNVTGLKRVFAIEVDDYDEKEKLLHTIFEKSRVSDTELFALDVNIAKQLLSSFDGTVIYPKTETKEDIFDEATDNIASQAIPDGVYYFRRKKKSEGDKLIEAKAAINNGRWTILEGSILSMAEGKGGSEKARKLRTTFEINSEGVLLQDAELGECSPSFAGVFVLYGAVDGWTEWKNKKGEPIDIYRDKTDNADT